MARKSVSLTVRIPTELVQKIEKTAAHRHKSVSDTIRFLLEREMNIEEHKEQTDEIRQIIRDEVNSVVKAQTNRMAAMLTRITILSASGYYAAIAAVALLDEDLYSSFESIEAAAREIGLEYANCKDNNGLLNFMKGEFVNKTLWKLKKDYRKGMLAELKRKFADKDITLILGSYFDVPLGTTVYEAAVSVESLHHFTKEEKIPLYAKLHTALKENGYFILTDYFSSSDKEEKTHRQNLIALKAEQGVCDDEFYHYDTPLTVKHETEALLEAGFSKVEVLKRWGATYTLKAVK